MLNIEMSIVVYTDTDSRSYTFLPLAMREETWGQGTLLQRVGSATALVYCVQDRNVREP